MEDANLLVGFNTADDAGVYRVGDDLALIQTVDFFTPIVDDPFLFGQIAAANALSDVYAMGGKPITALNVICFPNTTFDLEVLSEIMKGGMSKVSEAGAVILGGHTVRDEELKYGLSVTGVVSPDKVVTNASARPDDKLILTKPLGTGLLADALKDGKLTQDDISEACQVMATLNASASDRMVEFGATSCTDITGYGLLGHAAEMAQASEVGMILYASNIPYFDKALRLASAPLTGGSRDNQNFASKVVDIDASVPPAIINLMFNAQTSGGLLISISPETAEDLVSALIKDKVPSASIIGEVTDEKKVRITVLP